MTYEHQCFVSVVNDDIFNSKEKYLCHQCNCITNKAAHLAKNVFEKYPYANVYKNRQKIGKSGIKRTRDTPGTISIQGNGISDRYVIACFAQRFPGNSKYNNDTYNLRERWFLRCLFEISKIENLESVAFPYGIGCGAAGGSWVIYIAMIERFAKFVKEKQGATVVIYKFPDTETMSLL